MDTYIWSVSTQIRLGASPKRKPFKEERWARIGWSVLINLILLTSFLLFTFNIKRRLAYSWHLKGIQWDRWGVLWSKPISKFCFCDIGIRLDVTVQNLKLLRKICRGRDGTSLASLAIRELEPLTLIEGKELRVGGSPLQNNIFAEFGDYSSLLTSKVRIFLWVWLDLVNLLSLVPDVSEVLGAEHIIVGICKSLKVCDILRKFCDLFCLVGLHHCKITCTSVVHHTLFLFIVDDEHRLLLALLTHLNTSFNEVLLHSAECDLSFLTIFDGQLRIVGSLRHLVKTF